MTFKEALDCLLSTTGLPDDENQADFLKYLYEASAEIGNLLGLCKECIEGVLEPLDCEIELDSPKEILDVTHGQVIIDGFDLAPAQLSKVKMLKNGHKCPTHYHWDCNKPEKITFAPQLQCHAEYMVEIVEKIDPTELTCDDHIWDNKANHLTQLVIERAAIRALEACFETERAATMAQMYSNTLENQLASMRNPSFIERLKANSTVEPQAARVLEEYA